MIIDKILNFFKFIFSKEGRTYLAFIAGILLVSVFLKQCNEIKHLNQEVKQKQAENDRISNNYKASIDTLKQTYDSVNKITKATIAGYDITVQELQTKYSTLFGDISSLKSAIKKGQTPTSVVENTYVISEKIKDVDIKTAVIDSTGKGDFTISTDTVFSPGNSRTITGKIPYTLYFFNKKDSSIVNYNQLEYRAKAIPDNPELNFSQTMTVYTGLTKDKKTGEVTTWANTKYPGVNFTVLKGASIEDDKQTQEILRDSRKRWGIGFTVGTGAVFFTRVTPGFFMGFGITYTPKKLQFGR